MSLIYPILRFVVEYYCYKAQRSGIFKATEATGPSTCSHWDSAVDSVNLQIFCGVAKSKCMDEDCYFPDQVIKLQYISVLLFLSIDNQLVIFLNTAVNVSSTCVFLAIWAARCGQRLPLCAFSVFLSKQLTNSGECWAVIVETTSSAVLRSSICGILPNYHEGQWSATRRNGLTSDR